MLPGKNYDNAFEFSKVITQNIAASFIQRWCVIMTSRLRQYHVVMS